MTSRERVGVDVRSGTRCDRSTMVQSNVASHIRPSVERKLVVSNPRIEGEVSRGADIDSTYVTSWPGFLWSLNRCLDRRDMPDTVSVSRADLVSDYR